MTTTFEDAKVGDRVYSLVVGRFLEIVDINRHSNYPIRLAGNYACTYSGRHYCAGGDQTYFWGKPDIIAPNKPLIIPPVDTLVEVENTQTVRSVKRYSAGRLAPDGISLLCWSEGRTSITASSEYDTTPWKVWRVAGE